MTQAASDDRHRAVTSVHAVKQNAPGWRGHSRERRVEDPRWGELAFPAAQTTKVAGVHQALDA